MDDLERLAYRAPPRLKSNAIRVKPLPPEPAHLRQAAIESAAHAWNTGGSLLLGLWCSERKIRDYEGVIGLVRAHLGDSVFYAYLAAAEPQRTEQDDLFDYIEQLDREVSHAAV